MFFLVWIQKPYQETIVNEYPWYLSNIVTQYAFPTKKSTLQSGRIIKCVTMVVEAEQVNHIHHYPQQWHSNSQTIKYLTQNHHLNSRFKCKSYHLQCY